MNREVNRTKRLEASGLAINESKPAQRQDIFDAPLLVWVKPNIVPVKQFEPGGPWRRAVGDGKRRQEIAMPLKYLFGAQF